MKYQRKPGTVLAGNNFEPSPDSFPPDSIYWMRRARAMGLMCQEAIGTDALNRLVDAETEKPEHETYSWKELFHFYDRLFVELTAEQAADHADLLDMERDLRNG